MVLKMKSNSQGSHLPRVIGTHQGPTSDQPIDNSRVTHQPHHPQRLLQTGWILCLQFAHRSPGLRTSLAGPSKRHQNTECWESSNLALLITFLAVAMELSLSPLVHLCCLCNSLGHNAPLKFLSCIQPKPTNDKFRPTNGRPFEKFLFEIKSLSCVKAFVRVVERSIVRARSSLEVPDFQKQFGTTSAELKLDEA